jgi:serine/threonine protein kinase
VSAAVRFGKYDLLALLATGGMAEIWLARVTGTSGDKLVVIKRLLDSLALDHEYVEMFLDEARINARLANSNIVETLELGQVEGKYFMAMEYVPGLSVSQVGKKATQRLGDVPQHVACGIVVQACAGLHYAHEKTLPDGTPLGIIHRDVSPQNLILTFAGLVKVLDFGIAKATGRKSETRTGMVKGKFSYMSPEQCLGMALDRRSDVFALGIVLFELATARRLFKRGNTYQTYTAITTADVPPPRLLNPKIDSAVEDVILKSLRKSPDDRYATAEEMQHALERAMQQAQLTGGHAELQQFMEATFLDEQKQQRELVASAERGELHENMAGVSPVAVAAEAETRAMSNYTPVEEVEKTTLDPLPPLGEDSGRSRLASEEDFDPEYDIATRAVRPPTAADERATAPQAIVSGPLPTIYYAIAVASVLLVVLIAWLIAR